MELTYAARLLRELGRGDEALARLDMALTAAPTLGPGDRSRRRAAAGGRPRRRSRGVLGRAADAADAADEPALAHAFRMRAARMLLARRSRRRRAGDGAPAHRARRRDVPRAARWLEQRILRAAEGQADALRDSLRAEADAAERAGDKPRAAAIAYELALSSATDDDAIDGWRRVLALDPGHGRRRRRDRRRAPMPSAAPPSCRRSIARASPPPARGRKRSRSRCALGAALLEDARDAGRRRRASTPSAAERAPGYAPAREALDRVAPRSDDAQRIWRRSSASAPTPSRPSSASPSTWSSASGSSAAASPTSAAERYRHALEARPHHPIARAGARARAAGRARATRRWPISRSPISRTRPMRAAKVAAYERLAFIDGELRGDARRGAARLRVDHRDRSRAPRRHARAREALSARAALARAGRALRADGPRRRRSGVRRRRAPRSRAAAPRASGRRACRRPSSSRRRRQRLSPGAVQGSRARGPRLRHVYARARTGHDLAQVADAAGAAGRRRRRRRAHRGGLPHPRRRGAGRARAPRRRARALRSGRRARCRRTCRRWSASPTSALRHERLGAPPSHAAEQAPARRCATPTRSARFLLVAGALAAGSHRRCRGALDRALSLCRQALAAEPRSVEAFARLERSLHELARLPGARRALSAPPRDRDRRRQADRAAPRCWRASPATSCRIASARAPSSRRCLQQDAAHPEALAALADLQFEDEQWAEAAETLIRRARVEKSRTALKDIFFKLGIIYSRAPARSQARGRLRSRACCRSPRRHRRARAPVEPARQGVGLEGRARRRRMRLAELERDQHKRVAHLHRVAKIYEEGFKDARHALDALRDGARDRSDVPAVDRRAGQVLRSPVGRAVDARAPRSHLGARAPAARARIPTTPAPIHSLFKIFGWRRAPDRAAMAAGVLDWLGAADADEKAMLAEAHRARQLSRARRSPIRRSTRRCSTRACRPASATCSACSTSRCAKMFRADVKRLGVGAQREAAALGPRAARRRQPHRRRSRHARLRSLRHRGAPDGAHRRAHRAARRSSSATRSSRARTSSSCASSSGGCFKMIAVPHGAADAAVGRGSRRCSSARIVRQFVPDFVPPGFDEAAGGRRGGGAWRKHHPEEDARRALAVRARVRLGVARPEADRPVAGRTPPTAPACSAAALLGPALTALKRLGDEAQLRALLRFSVSDELAELRRQLGTAIG